MHPAIDRAVNAVRLHMDWRPLVGLTRDDEGTDLERLIAEVVVDKATALHNDDVKKNRR